MDSELETRDTQTFSARKRAKVLNKTNNSVVPPATTKSTRIKNLKSKLYKLSKEYQELAHLDAFDTLMQALQIKQNEITNEESCHMFRVLPQDIIEKCISYLDKSYGFIAPVSKRFQESYRNVFHGSKETVADFRSLSKDAGVYLIDSFPNSFDSIDYSSLCTFLFGKSANMRSKESLPAYSVQDYLVHKAARQGNLDVLRHYISSGYSILNAQDKNMFLFQKIAENGHLHVLEYLNKEYNFYYGRCCSAYGAAKGGHAHILDWLDDWCCFVYDNSSFREKFCEFVIRTGNLEAVKWMGDKLVSLDSFHDRNSELFTVPEESIVSSGNIDIVKHFVENGVRLSAESTQFAAKNGYIDILKYLISKNVDWDLHHLGHHESFFEVIKLQFEIHGTWGHSSIEKCLHTEKNNFNVNFLRYLCDQRCPWGDIQTSAFIQLKQLDLLEYIIENEVNTKKQLFKEVVQAKWMDGINYMLRISLESDLPSLTFACKYYSSVKDLEYFKSKGMRWEDSNILKVAETKNFEGLKLFIDQESPKDWEEYTVVDLARYFEYSIDVMQFLHENDCTCDEIHGEHIFGMPSVDALIFLHDFYCVFIDHDTFTSALNEFREFPDEENKEKLEFLLKIKIEQPWDISESL